MILGINTATFTHELALLKDGEILAEESWPASRDDVDRLVPTLAKLLTGHDKNNIEQIVVINGPGSFTAVRTGIAFANALAHALNATLHTLTTFELLAAQTGASLIVLHAGGQDVAVYHEGEHKVGPIHNLLAPFKHNEQQVYAEVRETQDKELQSIALEKEWEHAEITQTLGQVLTSMTLPEAVPLAEALYLKGPHIQKSKDKWKQ